MMVVNCYEVLLYRSNLYNIFLYQFMTQQNEIKLIFFIPDKINKNVIPNEVFI